MRSLLRAVANHADGDRVLGHLGDVREEIESAGRLSWIPFSTNMALTTALEETLGRDGMQQFYRGAFLSVWESPFLRALTEFVLRISGRDITTAAKNFSRGYPQIFRGVGDWSFVQGDGTTVEVDLEGFPLVCFDRDDMWLHSVEGSLRSLFDYAEKTGEVELRVLDRAQPRARYTLRET